MNADNCKSFSSSATRVAWRRRALAAAIASVLYGTALSAAAQQQGQPEVQRDNSGIVEEVVVQGRLLSSAAQLVNERIDDEVVSNLLGSEEIARVGDSTVAAALRRVSGLTLVNDKFIYVRGLGERYSSTTLNGARIPSVDLTRSVIPLDLVPTSVVESLRVQKSYSADQSAAFGGGSIDIRTKSYPDQLVYGAEIGAGYNTENDGEALTYNGGSDDEFGTDDGTRELSSALLDQVNRFRGDIGVQNILNTLRAQGAPGTTFQEAQQINRELASLLNRDISLKETNVGPDYDLKGYVGNSHWIGNDLEVGFLLSGAYEHEWREQTRLNRNFRFPEERTDEEVESKRSISLTGNGSFGASYGEDHELRYNVLFLRNTDDETGLRTFFNENRQRSEGIGFQNIRQQFEERELLVHQFSGRHVIGPASKDLLGRALPTELFEWFPEELELSWFYSDSEAQTDIPNQIEVRRQGPTDPVTGEFLSGRVILSPSAMDYRFTELDDEVLDYGWSLQMPFYLDSLDSEVRVAGGYRRTRQARTYEQVQFDLGPVFASDLDTLSLPLGEVFGDANLLDPANDYVFSRSGANNESYIAATFVDAWYGKVDWTWQETWRVSAGLRWEQYQQAALDFNPFGFSVTNPIITTDPDVLANSVFTKRDYYPSVSLTYMSDWMAETFQFRLGYSETVTRPDLREITNASYVDPLTNDLVFGNAGVTPALLTNYDARAEWFFRNGDNFAVSLFYRDIENPVEFFESPASDTNVAREIVNAESAEIYGVEFELLKTLGFIDDWFEVFFVQANVTLQDSELVAGTQANAPTNQKRELANAAPFIINFQLGYDSPDGMHSATMAYNVFDERLFVAGRNGAPDGFEQPFHSLDLTYSWYPTERITLGLKAQNILGESVEIKRQDVTTYEEKIGRNFSLALKWDF